MRLRSFFPFVVLSALGCSSAPPPAPDRALAATIALQTDGDGQHVTFGTQNGSTVSVLASDIAGKTVYWATTPAGEPVANATAIDQGVAVMGPDLTASIQTPAHYAAGPYELSIVVSVTGKPPTAGPNAGDLAGFDLSAPPAGEPPVTGASIRIHADGTTMALGNRYFIRFGQP